MYVKEFEEALVFSLCFLVYMSSPSDMLLCYAAQSRLLLCCSTADGWRLQLNPGDWRAEYDWRAEREFLAEDTDSDATMRKTFFRMKCERNWTTYRCDYDKWFISYSHRWSFILFMRLLSINRSHISRWSNEIDQKKDREIEMQDKKRTHDIVWAQRDAQWQWTKPIECWWTQ